MRERGASNSKASIDTSHVFEYDINDDLDALGVASSDHRFERISVASSGLNLVANSLVVGPPLVILNVLHSGAHCPRKMF